MHLAINFNYYHYIVIIKYLFNRYLLGYFVHLLEFYLQDITNTYFQMLN